MVVTTLINGELKEVDEEEVKKEEITELIDGEIYIEDLGRNLLISMHSSINDVYEGNSKFIVVSDDYFNTDGDEIDLKNVVRIATSKEKAWLLACIEADEFIPLSKIEYNENKTTIQEIW